MPAFCNKATAEHIKYYIFSKKLVNNFLGGILVKCFNNILISDELAIFSEKADQDELSLWI